MKSVLSLGLAVIWLGTVGCTNLTPRQLRALRDGAIGAAGGAAAGAIVGRSPASGQPSAVLLAQLRGLSGRISTGL
jgi:hypothetical protein